MKLDRSIPEDQLVGQFKRVVTIRCPIEKVFDYVTDWQTMKSFWSNIVDIHPISLVQIGPGATFDTIFKVGRTEIPTTLEVVEFVRDQKMKIKSAQGFKIISGWEFKRVPEGTQVLFTLFYEMPAGFLGNEKDRISVEQDFDAIAEKSMELLKWILESTLMEGLDEWR